MADRGEGAGGADAFLRVAVRVEGDTSNALGYREVDTQNARGINGGVWPSPPEGHNLVQLFVEVDDVDAYIEKAKKLGATVIVPKSELPDGDALAIVLDPAGLSFGLYRPRPQALS